MSYASSGGLLSNHRHSCRKVLMVHTKKIAGVKRKIQQNSSRITDLKKILKEQHDGSMWTTQLVRRLKSDHLDGEMQFPQSSSSCVSRPRLSGLVSRPGDSWEVDSGFSSEASPSASGRSSPCASSCLSTVVALDCEMPCRPVTDYRTPWSGIQKHHLLDATPFAQAREEILATLEGKVVIGHSVYNDFEVLDINHPPHMVRDTSMSPLLSQLAGFSCKRSLKVLTSKLLNRKIQGGRQGHNSVEDAQAALDLYKLVEGEWEREVQTTLRVGNVSDEPSYTSSSHYMQDQYWPSDVIFNSQ
ncbi:apoptosis-enhancing nuclease isoform X2 [Takifugu flavidus]|uniref:apoptosis-enhancing nuclease isoform X2 n=1 Tax=Takifugu flavidus TaxID=433684 RepID=UPI0025447BA6|nr:apoptosis-enhancing nuclease isoform X2 [Takifugu flavidus]